MGEHRSRPKADRELIPHEWPEPLRCFAAAVGPSRVAQASLQVLGYPADLISQTFELNRIREFLKGNSHDDGN